MTTPIDAQAVRANPFLLLLNPEAVVQAVEKSERLSSLSRHTCRPLDKAGPGETADGTESDALAGGATGSAVKAQLAAKSQIGAALQ